jgi:hypothetical protein
MNVDRLDGYYWRLPLTPCRPKRGKVILPHQMHGRCPHGGNVQQATAVTATDKTAPATYPPRPIPFKWNTKLILLVTIMGAPTKAQHTVKVGPLGGTESCIPVHHRGLVGTVGMGERVGVGHEFGSLGHREDPYVAVGGSSRPGILPEKRVTGGLMLVPCAPLPIRYHSVRIFPFPVATLTRQMEIESPMQFSKNPLSGWCWRIPCRNCLSWQQNVDVEGVSDGVDPAIGPGTHLHVLPLILVGSQEVVQRLPQSPLDGAISPQIRPVGQDAIFASFPLVGEPQEGGPVVLHRDREPDESVRPADGDSARHVNEFGWYKQCLLALPRVGLPGSEGEGSRAETRATFLPHRDGRGSNYVPDAAKWET